MTRSRDRGRDPTIREQILASLRTQGPASQVMLTARLEGPPNANTVRRELADLVARDEIQIFGHRRGSVGRTAYIYASPEYEPTDTEKASAQLASRIRPSSPEVDAVEPPLFSAPGDPLPAHALVWNPEYQLLWRNGLRDVAAMETTSSARTAPP